LHISEMAHTRVERVTDIMKEGDIIEVKVLEVGRDGKVRLTRRELLPLPEGEEGDRAKERMLASREQGSGPPRREGGGGGDRGGRGGGGRGPRRN
jgi:polyribonucleotide nucleotidyltransferase